MFYYQFLFKVFQEVRRNIPSILYIPNIDRLWNLISETIKQIILTQLEHLDPNSPILLLSTSDTVYEELPDEVNIFREMYNFEIIPHSFRYEKFFLYIEKKYLQYYQLMQKRENCFSLHF